MKKKSIIVFVFVLIFSVPFALKAQNKKIEKANTFFDAGEYSMAYELYVKYFPKLKEKAEKAEVSYNAGMCSKYMQDPQNSIRWFRKAILYKYQDPLAHLYLADAFRMKGLYDDAREYYANYKDLVPSDIRGENGLQSCDLAVEWKANPTRFIVDDIYIVNSRYNDFAAAYAGQDTNMIYFTSTRSSASGDNINTNSGVNFADIYVSQKDKKGKWTTPVPVPGSINSEYDDGSCVISSDGRTMYFTHCPVIDGVDAGCKIFSSNISGDQWGAPVMLEISAEATADTAMSVGQPAISPDELTLYFVSDDKKGNGGTDIWKITRNSKSSDWALPQNLGPSINTEYNELFPTVDNEGNLYFSSDGRIGMGGFDIFKATQDDDGIWTVENMQYPINSETNDFGIVFNPFGNFGYLSSGRNSGRGDDIFTFREKPLDITLKGFVINDVSHAYLLQVDVELRGSNGSIKRVKTDDRGAFSVKLQEEVDYMILTSKKAFLKATGSVSTKGVVEDGKVFEIELYMKPSVGTIKIPNIRYDFGDTVLREESKVALDELIEILEINSSVTIELRAHTDYRGSNGANLKLSQGRANSVVAYLIANGIKTDRLVAKGYGEEEPVKIDEITAKKYPFLEKNDVLSEQFILSLATEEQKEICHELNRRTEFKVLSEDYGDNYESFGEE